MCANSAAHGKQVSEQICFFCRSHVKLRVSQSNVLVSMASRTCVGVSRVTCAHAHHGDLTPSVPARLVTKSVTTQSPWRPTWPRPDGGMEHLVTVATSLGCYRRPHTPNPTPSLPLEKYTERCTYTLGDRKALSGGTHEQNIKHACPLWRWISDLVPVGFSTLYLYFRLGQQVALWVMLKSRQRQENYQTNRTHQTHCCSDGPSPLTKSDQYFSLLLHFVLDHYCTLVSFIFCHAIHHVCRFVYILYVLDSHIKIYGHIMCLYLFKL